MKAKIERLLLNTWVRDRLHIRRLGRRGQYTVGRHSYGVPKLMAFEHDPTLVTVGNFCSIGSDVTFLLGGNHPLDRITTFPLRIKLGLSGAGQDGFPCSKGNIVVGHDVWIGHGATVLSGVTLGNGAVVAAASVVTRNVPPYAVVAGSPAQVVKFRFPPDVVDRLMGLAWWDWDDETIVERVNELCSPDVAGALDALSTVHSRIAKRRSESDGCRHE